MALEDALKGKPWYYGLGIGVVLAVAIIFVVHWFLVKDINVNIQTREAELDELQKKIEKGRTAERQLPQFREEVKRLELELEKLRRILPSTRNTEEIIKKIKSLVDQGDFVLVKLVFPRIAEGTEEGLPAEWPITVEVDGRYHDLAILFNRLANFSRIINVEQFSINALPQQVERTIKSEFIAKTFVYVEPKTDTQQGTPGGAGGAPTTGSP
jgi:type IV pilus assembly protein PilO